MTAVKTWYQLSIKGCDASAIENLSDDLQRCGALSITLRDEHDNPVLEPAPGETPLWPDIIVDALFDDQPQQKAAINSLKQHYASLRFHCSEIADKDWQRAWMDDFHPICFGERLWVCPSWTEPPEPNAVNLMLDPGLAFGSGTHPTTALCLGYLDGCSFDGKTVIDYGCGSGILAIASLILGADKVYAVDIDEQALIATKANAENNRVNLTQLSISYPDDISQKADLVMANILAGPLLELKQRFKTLIKPNGLLVMSGILQEQISTVVEHYSDDFVIQEQKLQDDWGLIIAKLI